MPVPVADDRHARGRPARLPEEHQRAATSHAWYNAFTDNCTTSIRTHTKAVGGFAALDWRLLANGHLDELLYERGAMDTRLPLPRLKASGRIADKAKAADQDPLFAERSREGVPGPPRS